MYSEQTHTHTRTHKHTHTTFRRFIASFTKSKVSYCTLSVQMSKNQIRSSNIALYWENILCEDELARTYGYGDISHFLQNSGRRPAEPPATLYVLKKKKKRLAGVQDGHKVTTTGCCQPFVSHQYDLRSHPANSLFSFSSKNIQELTSTSGGRWGSFTFTLPTLTLSA